MRIFYNLVIWILIILSPIIIIFRILNKKENPKRFLEKFSLLKKEKKSGKLIWFHCSSVGEFLSILPIIEKLEKEKNLKRILLTTSTLSSSKIFCRFKFKKTIHQFYPIDNSLIVKKFLNYWQPSAVFFVESEIWPEMLKYLKIRKVKIFLLNARISKKSFKRWSYFRKFAINTFNTFDYIFPQNKETLNYLKQFEVKNIKILGNLKFSESENLNILNSLPKSFQKRRVLCAASTHDNEEEIISSIHLKLKKKIKNLLTIIIPRHIERSKKILHILRKKNLKCINHSEGKKLNNSTDIYLVDTYGESKSFYSISKVVFLGGSIVNKGGQNPIEPLRYGCNITHGKYVFNFKEVYSMLSKKNLSFQASNNLQLTNIIFKLLRKNLKNKNKINIFKKMGSDILYKNLKEIKFHI